MVIHIKDKKTDQLVRELARLKGISITAAIRAAVEGTLVKERNKGDLWADTADLRQKLASYPATGLYADKEFFDSL